MTVFIIIGILILGVISFYYLMKDDVDIDQLDISNTILTKGIVEEYVERCIEDVSVPGIYLLANRGGFIYDYSDIFLVINNPVAYHIYDGIDTSPNVEFMESELGKFVEDTISLCVKRSDLFAVNDIVYGEPKASVNFEYKNVRVDLNYPISLERDNSNLLVEEYSFKVPINILKILGAADEIKTSIKVDELISQEYLSGFGIEDEQAEDLLGDGSLSQELSFELLTSFDEKIILNPYSGTDYVISIISEYDEYEVPLIFNLAINKKVNSAPRLEFIPDHVVGINEPFTFYLNATDYDGDMINYYTEERNVFVNPITGMVSYTARTSEEKTIEFCAYDQRDKHCREVTFIPQ
ncbi:hypothetical protein C0585_03110 [Candidatus Woesearchaeota archaeon]|nr:MAG: hypothetical protein C0585_03110 [Candidatus Woesearchaeota archaeon]